jgi:hypothetical protein
MGLSDPRHPLWSIIRTASLMLCATLLLHVTATSFDLGEMKTIGGVGVASVAFDVIKRLIAKEG